MQRISFKNGHYEEYQCETLFTGSLYEEPCFIGADLSNANLEDAIFHRADFRLAKMKGANTNRFSDFKSITLPIE